MIRAERIGSHVSGLLAGRAGPVGMLARFDRHVYLDLAGTVLVVTLADQPPGPLTLHLPALPGWLGAGEFGAGTVQSAGGRIVLDGVPAWPSALPAGAGDPGRIAATLAARAGAVPHHSALLRAVLGAAPRPEALDLLARGIAADAPDLTAKATQALIGAGPGLTPAGDDLLAGTLMALYALAPRRAAKHGRVVGAAAREGTTSLSAAFLMAAARGHGPAGWHDLVRALPDPAPASVARVMAPGHSSGADTLAGFVLACAALAPG